jgi:hypothetical protein
MSEHYDKLTDGEKAYWDEYARLRELTDWAGFSAEQDKRKRVARDWLQARRKYIKQLAEGEIPGETPGWDHANRKDRYDTLHDDCLNVSRCKRICTLPIDDGKTPDTEHCYITEREMWWRVTSVDDEQKARKQTCTDWLVARRQQVWHDGEGDSEANPDNKPWGWDNKSRRTRYDQLQIATKYGSAYDEWCDTHNTTTGEPKGSSSSSGSGWRNKSADWHEAHLGITESPADSNCDSRSDGIRTSQDGCANGTWLRYQPWCGCWAWSGLYAAGKVKKGDSWLASVASIEDYAKAGKGPFKGWTTDGSKAKKGDLVILFGRGQHVGTVRSIDSGYAYTWEGNTSSGSGGSQSNGGGSYKRSRSRNGETYGYALVKD